MTDLTPTLEPVNDIEDVWLLTVPLSETGSTVSVSVIYDELIDLGAALTAVLVGKPGHVHGYGFDLELNGSPDALHVQVTGDNGMSALAVLPPAAIGQLSALIVKVVDQ